MSQLSGVAGEGHLLTPSPSEFLIAGLIRGKCLDGQTSSPMIAQSSVLTSTCAKSTTDQLASFLSYFALQQNVAELNQFPLLVGAVESVADK